MKVSQDKSKKSQKGVSVGTLETKETIDRYGSSIDKLTSLVNKLDMKLDREEAQYRPAVYQNRGRGHRQRQNNYEYRNRSYSQDRNQSYNRGRGNFHYKNRCYRPSYRKRSGSKNIGIEMVIGETTISKTIGDIIIDRTMVTKGIGIGIEVQVRTTVGLGRGIEAIPEITSEIGHMTEVKVEIDREKVGIETGPVVERKDKGQEQNLEIEIETGKEKVGPLQDLDLVPMLIPTGIDLDAIEVVSMIILQENALTH